MWKQQAVPVAAQSQPASFTQYTKIPAQNSLPFGDNNI